VPLRPAGPSDTNAGNDGLLDGASTVDVGDELSRLLGEDRYENGRRALAHAAAHDVAFNGVRLTIGRDHGNDVVLDDPNVSAFHAEVTATGDGLELRDLGSRNGTRLDGELVDRAWVRAGSHIGVGSLQLVFDGTRFVGRDDYGALWLEAKGISARVRGKQLLDRASFSLGPGELVAIIGESGAGKTTLLRALAGASRPDSGEVSVNGEPVVFRLSDMGYVPQQEIDHDALSIREGLTYAARLRLPDDASEEEIAGRVRDVLEELALTEHAETRVGSLSGGQRRRANVATELLGRPSLLLLDEPTTGMDPWLESKMMRLFRELADHSRGVALVTHATKNLSLCDRVVAIAPGGVLAFDGSPADALTFFEVDDFDGIYTALEETPGTQWRRRFEQSTRTGAPAPAAAPSQTAARQHGRRGGRRRLWRQTRTLTGRYAKLIRRDRRNLLLLLLLPPVLGAAGVGLFRAGVFSRPASNPWDTIQALFLAVVAVIFMGTIAGVREIVRERGVLEREAALGVRPGAYLWSKVIVLFSLMSMQTLLYCLVLFGLRPLDGSLQAYLEVFALLVATGFVAVAIGLLISAAVSTESQALTCTPLAVIPTLIFAGAIVPVGMMAAPAHALATVTYGRWSLAALGAAVDMNGRMEEVSGFTEVTQLGTHFFTTSFAAAMLILGGFLALLLSATFALLRR
jgi:ABC-type multidrug transport system ATPase subunit